MSYKQISGAENENFRNLWVAETLGKLKGSAQKSTLLDVGAGLSPYRKISEELGWQYLSHDFSAYTPGVENSGLQNESWIYVDHDFVCDILEIPSSTKADLVLCTEVFEHIPDPVRSFERICNILNKDGYVVITVPFLSLMHQAPFWFQSGLSPYWFEHWAKENGIKVLELTVYGDYVDLMSQEVSRLVTSQFKFRGLAKVISWVVNRSRSKLSAEILSSGGFGVAFIGQKL